MDLATRLKQAIAETHDRIERLPLAVAMAEARIEREEYLRLLGQLLRIHQTLEPCLHRCEELVGLYRPEMARAALLEADIRALEGNTATAALPETAELLARIRDWAARTPWALAGCLYVFEGSRLGSKVLVGRLAQALGQPVETGRGLDYHMEGLHDRFRLWQLFRVALNERDWSPAQQADVIQAATATMDALCAVYAALTPSEPALSS